MIDSSRACRSCLREGGEMKQLFLDKGERLENGDPPLDLMLMSSTQVQINKSDGLPGQICLNCTDRLINAFTFKKMCQESDMTLKQHLDKNSRNATNNSQAIKLEKPPGNNTKTVDINVVENPVETLVKVEAIDTPFTLHGDEVKSIIGNNEKWTQTLRKNFLELYNCPECQKKFSSAFGLATHMKKHISFEEPEEYCCTICDKQFKELDLFERHQRSHNKRKNFNCFKCEKVFNNVVAYQNHNCDVTSYKCAICNDKFSSPSKLNQHCIEAHKEDSNSQGTQSTDPAAVDSPVEYVKDEQYPITIKEEPLEDILEQADRENSILMGEESDAYLDMEELELQFQEYDAEFNPTKTKKNKASAVKKLSKKKLNAVNNSTIISCSNCMEVFPTKAELKKHQKTEHVDDKKIDNKQSQEKNGQLISKEYECETCKRVFQRQDQINKHMWQHMEHKPFQCDICPKGFLKQQHLDRHKFALHSGKEKNPKTAFCDVCCRGFTTSKYLETHMRMHTGDKTFTCGICDKSFNSKWHLKEHNRWHSAEKPFLCSECGQSFIRNDYLVIHMRRHTGEKPYKCKFCDKGFPRATDLTVHERYHTGEKTHLCTVCGKGFQRQYNLTVHLRVHTGEKPYVCSYCGKKFAQGNDLKSHVRRHTGERFNCDICGEGFIQVYHLTQHKKNAHGIEGVSHIRRVEKHPQVKDNAVIQLALASQNTKPDMRDVINNEHNEIQVSAHDTGRPIVPLVPLVVFSNVNTST